MGAGRIGTFHATTLTSHPDVHQVVIVDSANDRAEGLATRIGARVANSFSEVLDIADALVVATSTDAHLELVRAGVEAGIPTFCEKPVSLTLAPLQALADMVDRTSAVVQVGFQRRFDAGFLAAQRRLRTGTLGLLHTLRLVSSDRDPPHDGYIPLSGGVFRDLHIHDFDLIRWLTGSEVEEVVALGATIAVDRIDRYGDPGRTALALRLEDGTLVTITGSRSNGAGYDVRAELAGSRATVAVGVGERSPIVDAEAAESCARPFEGFLDRFGAAYRAELAAFVDAARGRIPSPCTLRDAAAALNVAVAAALSQAEARIVRLSDVSGTA